MRWLPLRRRRPAALRRPGHPPAYTRGPSSTLGSSCIPMAANPPAALRLSSATPLRPYPPFALGPPSPDHSLPTSGERVVGKRGATTGWIDEGVAVVKWWVGLDQRESRDGFEVDQEDLGSRGVARAMKGGGGGGVYPVKWMCIRSGCRWMLRWEWRWMEFGGEIEVDGKSVVEIDVVGDRSGGGVRGGDRDGVGAEVGSEDGGEAAVRMAAGGGARRWGRGQRVGSG